MTSRNSVSAPKSVGSRARTAKPKAKAAKANGGAATSKSRKAATKSAANVWTLRLYITGRGERSERALSNLRRLCEQNLAAGTYEIEVVDLMKHPELAKADQILAIPTLVRKLPEPMKRVIGDLSNADRALLSLDFPKTDSSAR
jgi:circadian clock protein KaiB